MSTTTKHEATIEATPDLPSVTIIREFDAPPERVFRAWTDSELVAQWLGPRSITTNISQWDAHTGGSYRYTAERDGEIIASFYGSFHEVRDNERLVQTFTYEGYPDAVALETMTFEALDGGRCRIVSLSLVDTIEARDMMLSSGMEVGINEGYEKLDELLARQDDRS